MNPLKALLEAEMEETSEQPEATPEIKARVLFQASTRFADSKLWDLQRSFFNEQGVKAWQDGIVPHYITSSSYVARSYAQLAAAWIVDQNHAGESSLRILELGAGSGQFTFHFLRHLETLWQRHYPAADGLPFTYVMSDVAARNLEFWKTHPRLQHWHEQGVLQFALFDVEQDESLKIDGSNETWCRHDGKGPLLVIGNYLFDSIRQDYWQLREGKPYLVNTALYTEGEIASPTLADIRYEFEIESMDHSPYKDNALTALLDYYRESIPEGVVSIPHYGKQMLDRLKGWCNQRLTLLSGDRGKIDWRNYAHRGMPYPAEHGSISTEVNYHALHWMVDHEGGKSWPCGHADYDFKVGAFTWEPETALSTFARRCLHFAEGFAPADQFVLKRAIEKHLDTLEWNELIAYQRFSTYDPKAFRRSLPRFLVLAPEATAQEVHQLDEVTKWVWENYFCLGEEPDLAFGIASLLYQSGLYQSALWFFERSVELYGPDSGTLTNIKNCKEMLT